MMRAADPPKLKLATVGLGNWAGRVLDLLLHQHDVGTDGFELVAACDPGFAHFPERYDQLRSRGIPCFERYESLLESKAIEAVVLPVPIHLHRPMTQQALAAGKAVLVEKPAAGCVQDVNAMIAARDSARLPVLVSFQDTYDPALLAIKRAIISGEIGSIRSASLVGCWPRDEAYYARTTWAGKIKHHGSWVLDSPVANAFAHYLHLALFLAGENENEWAIPQSVEAELYRVYPIENYDTASLRVIAGGVPVLILLTHACQQIVGPHIVITGDGGSVKIDLANRSAELRSTQGARRIKLHAEPRELVAPSFVRYVRNLPIDAALSTLEAARSHVVTANGASQAATVHTLGPGVFEIHRNGDESARVISGIEQVLTNCAAAGQMIHESGQVSWSSRAGAMKLRDYQQFTGCPQLSVAVHEISDLRQPRPESVHVPGAKQTMSRDSS